MKVVAFNGSACKDGNTAILVRRVFSCWESRVYAVLGRLKAVLQTWIGQIIIPGSSYWNIGIGRAKGEVEQDKEALQTMQTLGQNMAWLLKKIHA